MRLFLFSLKKKNSRYLEPFLMNISLIVAQSQNRVIGVDNDLPWRLSSDLKRFRALTTGHHILMGRKTYDSIGRPLPKRVSVVISRNKNLHIEGCQVVHSLEAALEIPKSAEASEVFVIGGEEIFKLALPQATHVYLTLVRTNIEGGDAFFPELPEDEWVLQKQTDFPADQKNEYDYSFLDYQRVKMPS